MHAEAPKEPEHTCNPLRDLAQGMLLEAAHKHGLVN